MSREERSSWANTRSFFYGAEATAQSAYDAMGAAIQEAEDVVEGAFEALEESIDHEMQGWHEKLPVHPFTPVPLGVPRCCGAFTPSTRVVSGRGGRGCFFERF